MTDKDLIVKRVVGTAKRWEQCNSVDDIDELDVRVVAGIDGTPREFIVVVTTGGPHIEVNVTNETVTGHWGSNSHTTHVNNEELCSRLHDMYRQLWNENIRA